MAGYKFILYQKGPENFYGTLMNTPKFTYKKDGTLVAGNDINNSFSRKFEYPIDAPTIISTYSPGMLDGMSYTLTINCNIPKCVDVSVKKVDYEGTLTNLIEGTNYNITRTSNEDDDSLTIVLMQIFNDDFKSTSAAMDSMYSPCLVFEFKEDTSFINIYTNSYNVEIGEESDIYMDDSKINYTFMTKPYDVETPVCIPMRFDGDLANVFSILNDQLLIETYTPQRSSNNIKGYYLGRTSSSISDDDIVAIRNGNMDYLNIFTINSFLNQTERNKLNNGENVDLYLWMRYSAPREVTPISARKIRIIKAY